MTVEMEVPSSRDSLSSASTLLLLFIPLRSLEGKKVASFLENAVILRFHTEINTSSCWEKS